MEFYVSKQGDDSWSGSLPEPNAEGDDGPFATIERAQAEVREVRAQEERPVKVIIRGGTYQLTQALTFTPEDGGSEGAPVTYEAYPGEEPVFSGGSQILGWERGSGSVWKARIPEVESGNWYFHQLFVDGKRETRARTPNEGYLHIADALKPLLDRDKARRERGYKIGFQYRDRDIKHWEGIEDVNIFLYHSWTCSVHWIDSLDQENRTVRFTNPSSWPVGYWDPEERYHLENYLEALDSPGEWYLDRETGILHYWPGGGRDPNDLEIVAPRLRHLVRIEGDPSQGRMVDHLVFRGLSFQYADWELDREKRADGQAATFLSAAVVATGTRNCLFESCEISHVGEYGLILGKGCKLNKVVQCEIHDLGGGGVRMGTTGLPQDPERQSGHNTVDNCFIHSGGHVFRAGIGVWIGKSSYNNVTHNEICDFYYSGCSVGWSWGYAPSSAHHNVLEYNHIHHLGKGVLSDMGGIYTLGLSPGTRERFNLIHDIYSYAYGGWGLYTDEGSSNITLEGNVVYNTKSGSFHQHYGCCNQLRNNILGPALDSTIRRSRQEDHISFTMEKNIIVSREGKVLGDSWDNGNYRMDYNLYWDVYGILGEDMDFGGIGFEEWRGPGRGQHSLVADPMFVDPRNHDYGLDEKSPALNMGFEPIDTERIGLYGEESWVQAPQAVSREPIAGFSPPLLREDGPVSYPDNLSKSDMWIIKYDPDRGRGTIPRDSVECALVWTIDGGRYPSSTPPGSQEVNGSCESPMKRGLDGMWYLIIPEQQLGAISLRFRDGVRGENWDDNRGERWWITSSDYVQDLLVEFDRVIANGSKYGADMSPYDRISSEAWEDYRSGEYGKAMNHLSGDVNRAWVLYTDRLLEFTASELESIRSTGVELGREERLLYLAELMKGRGKFGVAEGYCKSVLSELSEIRDRIPEGALFISLVTLLVARRLIN